MNDQYSDTNSSAQEFHAWFPLFALVSDLEAEANRLVAAATPEARALASSVRAAVREAEAAMPGGVTAAMRVEIERRSHQAAEGAKAEALAAARTELAELAAKAALARAEYREAESSKAAMLDAARREAHDILAAAQAEAAAIRASSGPSRLMMAEPPALRLAGALAQALAGASPKFRKGPAPNISQLAELAEDAALRALFPSDPAGNLPSNAKVQGMGAETLRQHLRAALAAVAEANRQ